MQFTRRKLLSVVASLPILRSILAKEVKAKVVAAPAKSPVVLPPTAQLFFIREFKLASIQEAVNACTWGNVAPEYMVVVPKVRDLLWSADPEGHHFRKNRSELRDAGFATFQFMGCEVVVDENLHNAEMVIVAPAAYRDDRRYNAAVKFSRPSDVYVIVPSKGAK